MPDGRSAVAVFGWPVACSGLPIRTAWPPASSSWIDCGMTVTGSLNRSVTWRGCVPRTEPSTGDVACRTACASARGMPEHNAANSSRPNTTVRNHRLCVRRASTTLECLIRAQRVGQGDRAVVHLGDDVVVVGHRVVRRESQLAHEGRESVQLQQVVGNGSRLRVAGLPDGREEGAYRVV